MSKILLTAGAAKLLGVSSTHIRRLAGRGAIPHEKTDDGRLIFKKNDVLRVVIKRAQQAAGN